MFSGWWLLSFRLRLFSSIWIWRRRFFSNTTTSSEKKNNLRRKDFEAKLESLKKEFSSNCFIFVNSLKFILINHWWHLLLLFLPWLEEMMVQINNYYYSFPACTQKFSNDNISVEKSNSESWFVARIYNTDFSKSLVRYDAKSSSESNNNGGTNDNIFDTVMYCLVSCIVG